MEIKFGLGPIALGSESHAILFLLKLEPNRAVPRSDGMLTRDDITPLSTAVVSGALVGLALGLWLALPPELSRAAVNPAEGDGGQVVSTLAPYERSPSDDGAPVAPAIQVAAYAPASSGVSSEGRTSASEPVVRPVVARIEQPPPSGDVDRNPDAGKAEPPFTAAPSPDDPPFQGGDDGPAAANVRALLE